MLQQSNAVIATKSRDGTAKLTHQRAYIGKPTPLDVATRGPFVKFVLLLDPGLDVTEGDFLTITSWSGNSADPTTTYLVAQVDPAGSLGLEVLRCVMSEWKAS